MKRKRYARLSLSLNKMKICCCLISTFGFFAASVQAQREVIYILKDSVVLNAGVQYTYSIKQGKRILYDYKTFTVALADTFYYHKKKLNYKAYVFYDEPTGRQFAVLYNLRTKSLYKTGWFDDYAVGDKIVQEEVDFKKKIIIIRSDFKLKFYNINLTLITDNNSSRE